MKNENPRTELPNRPDATERPMFRHHSTLPDRLPPGPGRHFDRKHFGRMEFSGILWMLAIVGIAAFWFGIELRLIPDVFGWHG